MYVYIYLYLLYTLYIILPSFKKKHLFFARITSVFPSLVGETHAPFNPSLSHCCPRFSHGVGPCLTAAFSNSEGALNQTGSAKFEPQAEPVSLSVLVGKIAYQPTIVVGFGFYGDYRILSYKSKKDDISGNQWS